MGRILAWGAAAIVGAALGLGSAALAIGGGARLGSENVRGWTINLHAGSRGADPWTRAIVARVGLLALAKSETIYFNLAQDEAGRPLREACIYELDGGAMPARWWSVTIYAADHYLPVNQDDAFSIDASRARADDGGFWRARIGGVRADDGNWISSRATGDGYSLTLRLYNPEDGARDDPQSAPVPSIRTLGCGEARP